MAEVLWVGASYMLTCMEPHGDLRKYRLSLGSPEWDLDSAFLTSSMVSPHCCSSAHIPEPPFSPNAGMSS